MGFVVDGLLLLLIAGTAIFSRRQSVSTALLTLLAVVCAVTGAYFLSPLAAQPLSDYVMTPAIEKTAANELADMVSVPHGENGRETVSRLPFDRLMREMKEPLSSMADRYGASLSKVEVAYTQGGGLSALLALTADYSWTASRSVSFPALCLLLFILLRLLFRRIEMNLPPPGKIHGFRRALPVLVGAVSGALAAMALGLAFEWMAPYSGQVPVLPRATLDSADLHRLLQRLNPFS